jgi:MEMO1 family protein
MAAVCQSPYAGEWYPSDPVQLRALLEDKFGEARQQSEVPESRFDVAVLVPHASPFYSGRVAASAFLRAAAHRPRRVLLIGFSHSGDHAGVAIPPFECYRTPLGDCTVDLQAVDTLLSQPPFARGDVIDHSVEIQIPFLQFAMPEAQIVPMFAGIVDEAGSAAAAGALASLMTHDTVLVASSDLTHYGHAFGFTPFPLDEDTPRRIHEQDFETLRVILALDLREYRRNLLRRPMSLCGHNSVSLLIETLRHYPAHLDASVVDYQQSGEITGDFRQSVSYAALAFAPRAQARFEGVPIGEV